MIDLSAHMSTLPPERRRVNFITKTRLEIDGVIYETLGVVIPSDDGKFVAPEGTTATITVLRPEDFAFQKYCLREAGIT